MIVGALLVRNEADRYLARVLTAMRPFCDAIVALDDGSTDATADVCRAHGCDVTTADSAGADWWGSARPEAPRRAELWRLAAERAGPGGWVLVFDADMELVGLRPEDLRKLADPAILTNAWAWVLYDAWNADTRHRVDGHWQASVHPRVWMVRVPTEPFEPAWPRQDVHVGHFPANLSMNIGVVPPPAGWRHLAYVRPEDRARKHAQYATA